MKIFKTMQSEFSSSSQSSSASTSSTSSTVTAETLSLFDVKDKATLLNAIPKLGGSNTDVRGWISQISTWLKIFNVNDINQTILIMKFTSYGDVPGLLDDYLEQSNHESNEPSIEGIAQFLLTEWAGEKKQNKLLEEIKTISIRRNESIIDFNKRFKKIYKKLDAHNKKLITVYDYKNAIKNRNEAWVGVHVSRCETLDQAYDEAELYDEIHNQNVNFRRPNYSSENFQSEKLRPNNAIEKPSFRKSSGTNANFKNYNNSKGKASGDDSIDDLTNKMKNLRIKTCYICEEEGHLKYDCPKLKKLNNLLDKLEALDEKNY